MPNTPPNAGGVARESDDSKVARAIDSESEEDEEADLLLYGPMPPLEDISGRILGSIVLGG